MRNLQSITDDDLLKHMQNGMDMPVFLEIYRRYHAPLYTAARKRCSSSEIAEEIVQDLFVKLWNNRQTIQINTSIGAYLHTAIRNIILNYLQKEAIRVRFHATLVQQTQNYDNSTEEVVLVKDLHKRLEAHLHALPERCRSVYELSRKQHKSNKQIAHELGITEKTVENQMTRALRFLRVSLQSFIFLF